MFERHWPSQERISPSARLFTGAKYVQVNGGLLSPEQFVHVTSTKAAQIFNIFPRKGSISVGSDADIIVFDPRLEHTISAATHHSQMDTNVYEGKKIKGKVSWSFGLHAFNNLASIVHRWSVTMQVVTTISRGRVAWHNNEFLLSPGSSRFISTPPGGPMFHGLAKQDLAKTRHPTSFSRLHHTQPLLQSNDVHDEL